MASFGYYLSKFSGQLEQKRIISTSQFLFFLSIFRDLRARKGRAMLLLLTFS
jgi:hypothetical protein